MFHVPVIGFDNKPLMPTKPSKARKLISKDEAIPFWKFGVFCIKLKKPVETNKQSIVLAIDPGSKWEGMTVKSNSCTYLNLQTDSVSWVKDNLEIRRNMRRGRRFRNTPCRKPRWANRSASRRSNRIPPSTKARYDLKLGIVNRLSQIYPIHGIGVEDIQAKSIKGARKWNALFSPLECGKKYFYSEIKKKYPLKLFSGWQTSRLRKILGLRKASNKKEKSFDAHCVDSWVMANDCVGGHALPENICVHWVSPIKQTRRQLHYFQYTKNNVRPRYGGTRSLGFKKGSIVQYIGKTRGKLSQNEKYLIGGYEGNNLTLCSLSSQSERLNRNIKAHECKFLSYNRFAFG